LQTIGFHSKIRTLFGEVITQGNIVYRGQDCLLVSMPVIDPKKPETEADKKKVGFWELLNLPVSTRHNKDFQYAYLHHPNGRKCGKEECQGDAVAYSGWSDEHTAFLCQDHLEAEIYYNTE
jgi:hypothetical protein